MIFRKRLQDTFCLEFLAEVWRSTWQGKSNFWNCIIKNLTFVYTTCILMENRKVYILPCAKCCLKLKKVNSLIHIHISIFGFCLRLKSSPKVSPFIILCKHWQPIVFCYFRSNLCMSPPFPPVMWNVGAQNYFHFQIMLQFNSCNVYPQTTLSVCLYVFQCVVFSRKTNTKVKYRKTFV